HRIDGAVEKLHFDVVGCKAAELDARLDRKLAADAHRIAAACFHGFHFDFGPRAAHAGPPSGELAGAGEVLGGHQLEALAARSVELVRILLHHAISVEDGADGGHAAFHHAQPAARQTVARARVEERDDLLLEEIVDGP